MSIDGGSVDSTEEIGHVGFAEQLWQRAKDLAADIGEAIEIEDFANIFRDVPPDYCSTLYPDSFLTGRELPDSENSYAPIHGIYSSGQIALAGKDSYLECHPEEKYKPDPNASLLNRFDSASKIASLVENPSDDHKIAGLDGPTRTL